DDRLVPVGLRVALAPAVQAVGGLDLHEQPVLAVAGIHQVGHDRRDLHARLAFSPPALPPAVVVASLGAAAPSPRTRAAASASSAYLASVRSARAAGQRRSSIACKNSSSTSGKWLSWPWSSAAGIVTSSRPASAGTTSRPGNSPRSAATRSSRVC